MNYIIDFIDSLSRAEIDSYCSENSITIIKEFSSFGNVFLCSSDSEPATDSLVESVILDDPNGIQLLGIDQVLTDNATASSFNINEDQNWWKVASIDEIDFEEDVYQNFDRGAACTVYVMDSGIKEDHPEFVDKDIELLYTVSDDYVDHRGHGTAMASVIVGETCGLTSAKVKVVKLFNETSQILQSDLLAGFDAVIADYIQEQRPAVVNCSWSIPFNEYINNKIQILINHGAFVVAAAGNSGEEISNVTPASMPDVLTIGAFNESLTPCDFSNYTSSEISLTNNENNYGALDGWGPGEKIWVANLAGSYGWAGGTSTAAAIVSGAIAYNTSRFVTDLGVQDKNFTNYTYRKEFMEQFDRGTFEGIVLSRNGLLDLSDPKYSNSNNLIATYVTKPRVAIGNSLLKRIEVISGGSPYEGIIFDRYTVERVVAEEAPEWMTVDERGSIKVNIPTLNEGELYNIFPDVEFYVYYRDGSHIIGIVQVIVTSTEITLDNFSEVVPDGDPILEAILLVDCTAGGANGCADNCSLPEVCEDEKPFPCFCLGA